MDVDVLIVGAGPTGLTMAAVLARHGISFRIIDSGRGATDLSKAVGVQARTLETLETMGLAEKLIAQGNPARAFNLYDDSRQIMRLSLDGNGSRYPYVLVVPQSDTERVLLGELDRCGVTVERNTLLTSFSQDETGVTAEIKRTPENGVEAVETVRARWMVGCDGAHSTVRHGLGLAFVGSEYEEGFLLADVEVEWDRPSDELQLFVHEGYLTAFFPLPGGHCRLIADLPLEQAPKDQTPSLEQCQKLVDERCPIPIKLSNPKWTSYYRVHHRIVSKLQEGRVLVAGDAAHIHSPAAAQGMNTGIQDSFNLAWKLALVCEGSAADKLLATYNEERYPVERGVLEMTDTLLKMVTLKQPLALRMRDALLPLVSGASLFQEQMASRVSETAVGYHGSSICLDFDHGNAPLAGDRAPDGVATHADGFSASLYQILRSGKLVLLLFPGHGDEELTRLAAALTVLDESPFVERVQRYAVVPEGFALPDGAYPLLDSPGEQGYRKAFGIGHASLRLIRPDGYIGLRASAAEGVAAMKAWRMAMEGG